MSWNKSDKTGPTRCQMSVVPFSTAQRFHGFVVPQVMMNPVVCWSFREDGFHGVLHNVSWCRASREDDCPSVFACVLGTWMYSEVTLEQLQHYSPHPFTAELWSVSISSRVSLRGADIWIAQYCTGSRRSFRFPFWKSNHCMRKWFQEILSLLLNSHNRLHYPQKWHAYISTQINAAITGSTPVVLWKIILWL